MQESFNTLISALGIFSFWSVIVILLLCTVFSLGFFKGVKLGSFVFVTILFLLYLRFTPSVMVSIGIFLTWFVVGLLYARMRWKLQFTKLKNRVVEGWALFLSKRASVEAARIQRKAKHEETLREIEKQTPQGTTLVGKMANSMGFKNGQTLQEKIEETTQAYTSAFMRDEDNTQRQEDTISIDLGNCELDNTQHVMFEVGDTESSVLRKFRPMFSKYRVTIAGWAVIWPIYVIKDFTIDLVRNALDLLSGNFQRAADRAFS